MPRKIVVTGCGRSGTGYLSKVLSGAGLQCGHESVFRPSGRLPWGRFDADSSWLAVPWLDDLAAEGTLIVHLVRNPLECARSFSGTGFFDHHLRDEHYVYVRAVELHVPEVAAANDPLARFVIYWTRWNASVLRFATMRIRIESFGIEQLRAILLAAGYDVAPSTLAAAVEGVPTRYNHGARHDGLRLDELLDPAPPDLRRSFVELAAQLGYEKGMLGLS